MSKQVGRASPLLAQMATTLESAEVFISMYKQNPQTGVVQHYFTIHLRDVVISKIEQGHTDVAADRITYEEHVSFTYRRIDWTHELAGTSGSADVGGGAGR